MKRMLWLALVALVGCEDKAQPDFGKCAAAEATGDLIGAAAACEAAVKTDPTSTSGKAAAEKLAAMQPRLVVAKEAKVVSDAKAEDDARAKRMAAAAAEADAKKEEIAALGRKVSCAERSGDDDECLSAGKPKTGRRCTGSTYQENERYALLRGCVHTRYISTSTPPDTSWNYYCCPN